MGATPIIKSSKLHHVRRVVVERQELSPRETQVRWKADFGKLGAAAVAVAMASAGAHATPAPPEVDDYVPAAEVAIAPLPELPEPAGPRLPVAAPVQLAGADYAAKIPELKENPYIAKREPKGRLVRKPRAQSYERVSTLKANPYE